MKYYINYAKKLLFIINKKASEITKLIFLFLFASLIEVLGIGLIIPFINLIIQPENFQAVNFYGLVSFKSFNNLLFFLSALLVSIFITKTILSIYIRWAISKFAFEQYAYLQIKMMSTYQNMGYLEFIKRNKSEYTRNVKEMTSATISAIETYLRLVSETLIFFVIIFYLGLINFKLIFVLFLILGLIALVFEFIFKPLALKFGKQKAEGSNYIYRGIDAAVRGMKEIRILQKENFFLKILKKGADKVCRNETKQSLINHSPRYIFELVLVIFLLSFLSLSILTNNDINKIIPVLSVFAVAAARLLPGVSVIIYSINILNYFYKSVNIVYDDLKRYGKFQKHYLGDKSAKNLNKINFKNLQLSNITFKYPKLNKKIINNVSLEIKAKECLGIVGPSGSGKSTLMDIILGLIKPNKGKILVNGKEINTQSNEWKSLVTYLPQEPLIMEDTIKNNISIDETKNQRNNNLKRIKISAKQADIDNYISRLKKTYKTKIGENGIRLSGGQNKRIAIARAFFHDRQIIVMDEATSSLDQETESTILEQLKILKKNKTIILITHNPNTLKYCDKVYKIEKGKINKITNKN